MTPIQVIFIISAVVILLSALMVVSRENLVHAALNLVLTLFGVAVLFVLLEAPYMAVIQVLIYIGAIAILMIFAVMLTRRLAAHDGAAFNKNTGLSALMAVFVLAGLVVINSMWSQYNAVAPAVDTSGAVVQLGTALVDSNRFVIPFEVASVLLLAAMIGAIMIAWQRK